MSEPLVILTEDKDTVLRELSTENDDQAYYDAIRASRDHLLPFEADTYHKYPTLDSVHQARLHPSNPEKVRVGIWNGDTFVGSANLIPNKETDEAEIGYWLDARHTGHGYATIAARALAAYGSQKYSRVFAKVNDGNEASERVLNRAGFTMANTEPGKQVFELETPEMDWTEAIKHCKTLKPGTIIKGFEDIEQVDIFTDNIGRSLRKWGGSPSVAAPRTWLNNSGRKIFEGWGGNTRVPSAAIKPKNFHGKFKNIQIVLLEDSESPNGLPVKSFVVFADMHSTGIGFRGRAAVECKVGNLPQQVYGTNDSKFPGEVTVGYKKVRGQTPEAIADAIIEASSENSRRIVINGLRHVLSGGLPGAGKKR